MWQVGAPFWGWAVASIVLGLGFTFFSGAIEAWLVDALGANDYDGDLESVFGQRGQVVAGVAMLGGSVTGGAVAQLTNLGVPYVLRAALLAAVFAVAYRAMRDEGFAPHRGTGPIDAVRSVVRRLHRSGPAEPPGALGHVGGAVHDGGRHLRVLRHAAVSAGAVR